MQFSELAVRKFTVSARTRERSQFRLGSRVDWAQRGVVRGKKRASKIKPTSNARRRLGGSLEEGHDVQSLVCDR
jgi:hypothetical protein